MNLKLLWLLYPLRQYIDVDFNFFMHDAETIKMLKNTYGENRFNKQYKYGKEKIKIRKHNNLTVIRLINFPRMCGKTTYIANLVSHIKEKCAIFTHNSNHAFYLKDKIKKFKNNFKQYQTTYVLTNCQYVNDNFQYFFFDEFDASIPKNMTINKAINKVTNDILLIKQLDYSKPSIAIIIH